MAVLRPRNRIITFRVGEEEFERLKNLSVAEGARSLSDFARAAVYNAVPMRAADNNTGLDAHVRKLDGKVEELERLVGELADQIGYGRLRKKAEA